LDLEETYIPEQARWTSLNSAIDLDSALVDMMLSEQHNLVVVKRF